MKSFIECVSYLAGFSRRRTGVGRSVPASRKSRRVQSFRPGMEQLETREVPSAVPVVASNLALQQVIRPPVFAPAAPSYSAPAISGSQVNILWNQVGNANGYVVDEWVNGAWKQIDNVSSSVTSVSVTGLVPGTLYWFDVASYNSVGTTWGTVTGATTLTGMFTTINHPVAGSVYSPVSGSLFGPNGPSYLDVVQGAVGDCWLEASLAETAARDPQDIVNMFTYDGTTVENGSTVAVYSVRLFDNSGTVRSIVVDTELPAGGGLYDHPANGVLWVALAEKAYAEANGAGYVTTGSVGTDSYAAMNNGYPAWALHAITGKAATGYSINPTNIAAAWNAGELIVLCTSNPASSDIVGSHCYAIVGYNASSSLPFEVYNPWGTNSSGWALSTENGHQVYGLFTANAAFISQNFTSQTFGTGAKGGMDALAAGGHGSQMDDTVASFVSSRLSEFTTGSSPNQHAWDSFFAEAGTSDQAAIRWDRF